MHHFIFSGLFKSIASFVNLLDDVLLAQPFYKGKFTFCDAAKCATDSRYESRFVAFCNFINDSFTPLQTIGIISILYAAFEGFINRNYAIASFFITPMSLLLSNLARQQVISNLLNYRLVDCVR